MSRQGSRSFEQRYQQYEQRYRHYELRQNVRVPAVSDIGHTDASKAASKQVDE